MRSTENKIDTIHALNVFYLEKLSSLASDDKNIYSSSSENDYCGERFIASHKMMAQTSAFVFGLYLSAFGGDIERAKAKMREIFEHHLEVQADRYQELYRQQRNENG